MPLLLKNGYLVDPLSGWEGPGDLLVAGGYIEAVGQRLQVLAGTEVMDLGGRPVLPGLLDLHTHLRDPGYTEKEDLASGSAAAAAGGYTAVVAMPNTHPVMDTAELVADLRTRAAREARVRVYPAAAITRGQAGRELVDMAAVWAAGVRLFTDDGQPVMDAGLMYRALEKARELGAVVMSHCEDRNLTFGGVINQGMVAHRLGLPGVPACAEEVMVARDLLLARATGGRLHLTHLSTAGSVELVRRAKAEGLPVTCDVTPHHLFLTEEAVLIHGADARVNPPLRTLQDTRALLAALLDGTVDAIATDHAPHTPAEKARGLLAAPNGVVGLETALALGLHFLVRPGKLSLAGLVAKLSSNPARLLGQEATRLQPGHPADLTVIDPDLEWQVEQGTLASKGKNTPFAGWRLSGKTVLTLVGGRIAYQEVGGER